MTPPEWQSSAVSELSPDLPLLECPMWPTMQWLPAAVVRKLDVLVRAVKRRPPGFSSTRSEVVSALILGCDPLSPPFLEHLGAYRAQQRPTRPPRKVTKGIPVTLRVPSPITLRLDALIREIARVDSRVYRHEVVATLILHAGEPERVEGLCRDLHIALARAAGVGGQPLSAVLTRERPAPGART
ncbi:MAG TPA: hypothetical protein VMT37_04905 [Solirubrobacterales bacterium]|nr:hypothetical protein [Solirubrobacterales bacterium]